MIAEKRHTKDPKTKGSAKHLLPPHHHHPARGSLEKNLTTCPFSFKAKRFKSAHHLLENPRILLPLSFLQLA